MAQLARQQDMRSHNNRLERRQNGVDCRNSRLKIVEICQITNIFTIFAPDKTVYVMGNTIDFSNQNALLDEIRKGNNAAFEYLFKNYYPRLCGYAARFVNDREVAKDVIQECFMKIWEKRDALKAVSITSLLFTMTRNACLDYLKHLAVVEQRRLEYQADVEGEEKLYYADFSCDTEYETLYGELEDQIRYVIDRLPCRCKEVFILSRFEGLKNREIAEKLQISVKAVEKHISKALSDFSTHFKNKYPPDVYIMAIAWLIMSQ